MAPEERFGAREKRTMDIYRQALHGYDYRRPSSRLPSAAVPIVRRSRKVKHGTTNS